MYRLLSLLILLLPITAFSRHDAHPVIPKPFEFVLLDSCGATQSALFAKASQWMAIEYDDAKEVINYSNPTIGKIIGKAVVNLPWRYDNKTINEYVRYTLEIDVTDGSFRCRLSHFIHLRSEPTTAPMHQGNLDNEYPNPNGLMRTKVWQHIREQAVKEAARILNSFRQAMKEHSEEDKS